MSRASFLGKRFSSPGGQPAAVCSDDMNKIMKALEGYLSFNDTPTIKWDVSETGGLRANAWIPDTSGGHECGFQTVGFTSGGKFRVHFRPSYLIRPTAEKGGRLAYIMPEFEGKPLDAPTPIPFKELDDGNWIALLYYTTNKAEIRCIDADNPPQIPRGERATPISTFTVENGGIKDLIQIQCDTIVMDGNDCSPFQPIIFDKNYGKLKVDGTKEDPDTKLLICPGGVIEKSCAGINMLDVLDPDGGNLATYPMAEIGLEDKSGSTLYAKIETDPFEEINVSQITTEWHGTKPTTIKACSPQEGASSGTNGVYWMPLFKVLGDDDAGWYTEVYRSDYIDWKGRQKLKNIGGKARVFKETDCGTCEDKFRTIEGKPGYIADSDSEKRTLNIIVTQKDETIEISGDVEVSDIGGGGSGIDGDIYHTICGVAAPEFRAQVPVDPNDPLAPIPAANQANFVNGAFQGNSLHIDVWHPKESESIKVDTDAPCKLRVQNNIPAPDYLPFPDVFGIIEVNMCLNGVPATSYMLSSVPKPLDSLGNSQAPTPSPLDPGVPTSGGDYIPLTLPTN